jgi:hypothetical protein
MSLLTIASVILGTSSAGLEGIVMERKTLVTVSLSAVVLMWTDISVRAETVRCTELRVLPTTITTPGVYCLRSHHTLAEVPGSLLIAITISANNVVLDLNGFRLAGPQTPNTFSLGIFCESCRNVTVRNGTIVGFNTGIILGGLGGAIASVIEKIRVVRNTQTAIEVRGHAALIRDNEIVQPGGTTALGRVIGIEAVGSSMRVINNDIDTVRDPNGEGAAIFILGETIGIPAEDNLVINNRITNADEGINFFNSTGKFRDNITSSVDVPYIEGTDIGNNN